MATKARRETEIRVVINRRLFSVAGLALLRAVAKAPTRLMAFAPLFVTIPALAQPDDREEIVRLTSQDDAALRRFLRERKLEVLRYFPPEENSGAASALVLMRPGQRIAPALPAEFEAVTVSSPPKAAAEEPRVGDDNRYANKSTRPPGRGVLVR